MVCSNVVTFASVIELWIKEKKPREEIQIATRTQAKQCSDFCGTDNMAATSDRHAVAWKMDLLGRKEPRTVKNNLANINKLFERLN